MQGFKFQQTNTFMVVSQRGSDENRRSAVNGGRKAERVVRVEFEQEAQWRGFLTKEIELRVCLAERW